MSSSDRFGLRIGEISGEACRKLYFELPFLSRKKISHQYLDWWLMVGKAIA
jgi:hypothetical protein